MWSKSIIGKPVVAIRTGKIVGCVRSALLDSSKQEVIGFIVDDKEWYLATKILLFAFIRGIDKEFITVEEESNIMPIANFKAIQKHLEENIQIIGHKVISELGEFIGFVEEFSFNPSNGKILNYKVQEKNYLINANDIISIGREIIVVKETAVSQLKSNYHTEINDQSSLSSIFERRQVQFILGKRLIRDLVLENGEIIGYAGQIVNEEVIKRAKNYGKFTELVMSVEYED